MNINNINRGSNMYFGAWKRDQYKTILGKISDEIKAAGRTPNEDIPVVKYFRWLDNYTYGSDLYIDKNLRIHDGAGKISYCPEPDKYSIAPLCEGITKLYEHLKGRGVNSLLRAGLNDEDDDDMGENGPDDDNDYAYHGGYNYSSPYSYNRMFGSYGEYGDDFGDDYEAFYRPRRRQLSPEVREIRKKYPFLN